MHFLGDADGQTHCERVDLHEGASKMRMGPCSMLLAARPRAARSRRRRRDFESEGVKMSIFSMVLRLCISHTHSIEAFIIWDVLRRLVAVPGIYVRLVCHRAHRRVIDGTRPRPPAAVHEQRMRTSGRAL